ncbi:amino acid adenylation domain-containing protein [Actinoalloteichus caeruleus]|uniref:non-ribosomal peptide synthetase n=1 Tax=Actinoalloteichus cyanogriseus TaxID=2893586 RepID=UPI003BB93B3C
MTEIDPPSGLAPSTAGRHRARACLPVHEEVRARARSAPRARAVLGDSHVLTYQQLDEAADDLADRLRDVGVVEGAAVAVRMPGGAAQAVASLGALRAGGHLVWLGVGELGTRGRHVLAQTDPVCLLRTTSAPGEPDELVRWYREELGRPVLDVHPPRGRSGSRDPGPTRRGGDVPLDLTAYVAHTSGSTGVPKGVAQDHRSLLEIANWLVEEFDLGPGSRVAQWAAPDHDPSLCETFAALIAGATLCPVPPSVRVDPERLLDWLTVRRVTFLQTVPSVARELLRLITRHGRRPPPTLRALLLMGEALPGNLARELRAVLPTTRLANVYGPTETIAATWHEVTGNEGQRVPIGRPIPGREVLVVDEQDLPCPVGVAGEIVVRGRCVAKGYLGDEGASAAFAPLAGTAAAPPTTRCYRTGDRGRRRPDGLLEFLGRRDDQVKVAGVRVEPAELEADLASHESVRECAVVPAVDADGLVGRLIAHVVTGPAGAEATTEGTPAVWRAHLRRVRVGPTGPLEFVTRAEPLPRTVAGKVDRRALIAAGPTAPPGPTTEPPPDQAEGHVLAVVSDVLGVPRVEPDVSFFAQGGSPPLLLRVLVGVRGRFDVEVTLQDLLANPTPAGMAALVGAAVRNRPQPGPSAG